jgi:MFS superfamily sulfate permease-like transporter
MEVAGAFGDLGTLIPFLAGYLTLNGLDPVAVLVAFGAASVGTGLFYRSPLPVQPMKAIGAVAIASASTVTSGMIWGAGLGTGVFWLLAGASGAIRWIEHVTTKPVVRGLMLGLGLTLMGKGLHLMAPEPWLALGAVAVALGLSGRRRLPAMLVLVVYGAVVAILKDPTLPRTLAALPIHLRWPGFALSGLAWSDLVSGFVALGLPQIPLTLGNAVLGTAAHHNALFPDRPVSARTLCLSTGAINVASACVGGVPMCHGVGGLAAHHRFGARTGGALVVLGSGLLAVGLLLGDSVSVLLRLFPVAVLGTLLLLAGVELALVVRDVEPRRENLLVLIVTAGVATWNLGLAYLAGLGLYHGLRRGWVRV